MEVAINWYIFVTAPPSWVTERTIARKIKLAIRAYSIDVVPFSECMKRNMSAVNLTPCESFPCWGNK